MFKNYLKLAARIFVRHKYFSLINAFGLALGMSFSLLLISFYSYVSSFDEFHAHKESIYRVITTRVSEGNKEIYASTPPALAHRLKDESADVKEITLINSSFHGDVVSDRMNIPIHGYYAEETFSRYLIFN